MYDDCLSCACHFVLVFNPAAGKPQGPGAYGTSISASLTLPSNTFTPPGTLFLDQAQEKKLHWGRTLTWQGEGFQQKLRLTSSPSGHTISSYTLLSHLVICELLSLSFHTFVRNPPSSETNSAANSVAISLSPLALRCIKMGESRVQSSHGLSHLLPFSRAWTAHLISLRFSFLSLKYQISFSTYF